MIYSRIGKLADNFYLLGHPAIPVYLLDGSSPVIFDAGLTMLGQRYIEDIQNILGERQPEYCFLTHVHFDHCGAVAILKERYPQMKVVAARKASEILKRHTAIDRMRRLNAAATELLNQIDIAYAADKRFETFNIDCIVEEGDRIGISTDCTVNVIESPGHTWDCISFLVSGKNILFSSEAAGQADRTGYIVSDCLADYDRYFQSLLKLKALSADMLCPGHLFVYNGDDVTDYFEKAVAACIDFRRNVEEIADETNGNIETIIQKVKAIEYDPNPGPKQPEPAYLINLEARIKAVLKAV
jgi:glyoxylase-like metal-dependent hydrolase (beta-lactamase superfamily II)